MSCNLASPSEVNAALGTSVSSPTVEVNTPTTVCNYASGANPAGVIIRYETAMTTASFNAGKSEFTSHGESTTDVSGIGNDAYSSSISGPYGNNTLVVLKGSTELLITASASLAQVTTLANEILPRL